MKFGQLLEYNKGNIFLQMSCIKSGREISSRPLLIFLKSFTWGKSKLPATWFHYISIARKLAYNINKLCKTLSYWSGDILHFDFLEKCLGSYKVINPCKSEFMSFGKNNENEVFTYHEIQHCKKWSFLLRISSINVTNSARNWRFCHICWRDP